MSEDVLSEAQAMNIVDQMFDKLRPGALFEATFSRETRYGIAVRPVDGKTYVVVLLDHENRVRAARGESLATTSMQRAKLKYLYVHEDVA